ncbi:MAG: Holliday junction branch migration protein RuvA [Myxococcales bacterium]|nr:Holliday junction branch migration protein RuvA [Myxococcales bacterium]
MIASLRGKLIHKDSEGIVLECAGVGYGLNLSMRDLVSLPSEGQEAFVWVHTHVSQDNLRLYGFIQRDELHIFEILLSVSGVGPRLALAILSELNAGELAHAVEHNSIDALTKISGVGKKTAQSLLLELKDKVGKGSSALPVLSIGSNQLEHDLVSALENLGFKISIAENAAKYAIDNMPGEENLSVLVKEALQATVRQN